MLEWRCDAWKDGRVEYASVAGVQALGPNRLEGCVPRVKRGAEALTEDLFATSQFCTINAPDTTCEWSSQTHNQVKTHVFHEQDPVSASATSLVLSACWRRMDALQVIRWLWSYAKSYSFPDVVLRTKRLCGHLDRGAIPRGKERRTTNSLAGKADTGHVMTKRGNLFLSLSLLKVYRNNTWHHIEGTPTSA